MQEWRSAGFAVADRQIAEIEACESRRAGRDRRAETERQTDRNGSGRPNGQDAGQSEIGGSGDGETVVMELLSEPAVKAGLALLILIIVSSSAFFLVSRLRDYTSGDWESGSGGPLNLEEMRLKGDISQEEFRTIQAASRDSDDGDAVTPEPPAFEPTGHND